MEPVPSTTFLRRSNVSAPDSLRYLKRRQQIIIVVCCLALTFTGCGFNFAFGVYEEHYETLGGPFENSSPGDISLIGTLAASFMTIGAPFANKLTQKYGARRTTTAGGLLFALASISASFGTRIWHFQLTQGFLQGCAACMAYIPAVTVSPGHFDERRALAMGIILSGTGLGGIVWAPFLRYLISAIEFRNTLRVMGILAAVLIVLPGLALEENEEHGSDSSFTRRRLNSQRILCSQSSTRTNWKIIFSKEFLAHAGGAALQSAAYFTPIYFMSSYATTLGFDNISGARIIAFSNACNFLGKIVIGYIADRSGRLNVLLLSTFVSAAVTFGLWYVSSIQINNNTRRELLLAYAAIYGATSGAYVSLFPTALVEQFGIQDFASINGIVYMVRGFGTLIGTWIGGALVKDTAKYSQAATEFSATFLFVGLLLAAATISVAWARRLKTTSEWRA